MNAPATIQTERLLLRKPKAEDAASIFERYAADTDVCRYLSWPRHRSIEDTWAFLEFSDSQWQRWPAGPYLICSLSNGELLGSTGSFGRKIVRNRSSATSPIEEGPGKVGVRT
jgi:ribosomal-protein-alanine N-acetyltransferase